MTHYADHDVRLLTGERAVSVDRHRRRVELASGTAIGYGHLVLALGARNRVLPVPGHDADGVMSLHTLADAVELRERLACARRAVVIGGGFVGMEFAAVAAERDIPTVVVEAGPRIMARAVSPAVSRFVTDAHRRRGVRVLLDTTVRRILTTQGRVSGVETSDGRHHPADQSRTRVFPRCRPTGRSGVDQSACGSYGGTAAAHLRRPAYSRAGRRPRRRPPGTFPAAITDVRGRPTRYKRVTIHPVIVHPVIVRAAVHAHLGGESQVPESAVVEVAVGLALVFVAFSVAISRVNEILLGLVNYRGRRLEVEMRRLVGDVAPDAGAGALTGLLFDGPLRSLRAGARGRDAPDMASEPASSSRMSAVRRARRLGLPSYIPSTTFARAVVDHLEPPARALLGRINPATLPASARDAYHAADRSLTRASAQALDAAVRAVETTPGAPAGIHELRALTGRIVRLTPEGSTMGPMDDQVAALPDAAPMRAALHAMMVRSQDDRERLVTELAQWYDEAMDRLSGWYRRSVQRFLFGYAVVVVVLFNLDTVAMTQALWQNPTVRAATVATASAFSSSASSSPTQADADETRGPDEGLGDLVHTVRDVVALQLPFGWDTSAEVNDGPRAVPDTAGGWTLKVFGWLVTALAISLGAPFWFDLLSRVVNMRETGPRPRATG